MHMNATKWMLEKIHRELGTSTQQGIIKALHLDSYDMRIIDILAPGGGYILSPGHPVLQDELPVENILAMYETAYDYK